MSKRAWILGGIVGIIFGYLIGSFAPIHKPMALALDSGTYCCDRIDINQKCSVKTSACPIEKPITVLIP